ncbi:von Willebrand factor type A domain protein [Dictyocaulus viviparus]|uniref:von Willebrand factor type A domain protein n=1 Tax=Dictyocaulus viviparus TaxID=29172 RepID=A0A0D8XZ74_DICVI|nr:von Willebrand factor type A domain protein [Dictyocaulus viviparus]
MRTTLLPFLVVVLINTVLTCVDVLFILDPTSELSRPRAVRVASELSKRSGLRTSLAVRRQNGGYVFMMTENSANLIATLESIDGKYERYLAMVTNEITRRRQVRPLIILLFSEKQINESLMTQWKELSKDRQIYVFRVGTINTTNELSGENDKSFEDILACSAVEQKTVDFRRRPATSQNSTRSTNRITLPFSKTTRPPTTTRPITVSSPKLRPVFRSKEKKEELTKSVTPPMSNVLQTNKNQFETSPTRFTTTPIISTSITSTTTVSTTTTQRLPPGCVADVIFLMDFSDSDGDKSKHYLDLAAAAVGKLPISSNAVQVALIRYSGPGRTETLFHFGKHATKDELIEELFRIEKTGGTTRTGEAIRYATKEFDNVKYGSRKNAKKFIVVFTDGYSQDDPIKASDDARSSGISMIAVAVDDNKLKPNKEELVEITKNKDVYHSHFSGWSTTT